MRHLAVIFLLLGLVPGCATIEPERVTPFADYGDWYLGSDLRYDILDSDSVIIVPAGFVTDYASIPRSLCLFLPKQGKHSRPAIVHDFLYWSGEAVCTQEQADQIMYLAMYEQGVNCDTREQIYQALRLFGKSAWQSNAEARLDGRSRVIPGEILESLGLPDGVSVGDKTWSQFRPEVDRYYAGHPGQPAPMGLVDVDWVDVQARFEALRNQNNVSWWKFWKRSGDCD